MIRNPVYRLLFLVVFVAIFSSGKAQQQPVDELKSEIIRDQRLDLLVKKHIRINQSLKTVEGFRIQLFSDSGNNSKSRAQTLQDELNWKYPLAGVYLSFKSPNYRIRLGDFRTRLDAQRFLNEITIDYPNAFIVNDFINLPKP